MLNNREKILFVGAVILISLFLIMPHTFAYMRTYNYTDIKNVSTTHKANYSVRGVGTFEFGTGPQASANNYTNVTASDNVKATATTSNEEPLNNESGHIFDFKLEEPKSGISSIRVVWEGATGADCSNLPGGSEALNAYFYNFSSNSWHKFAGACPLSGDVTLTGVLDTKQNISNFVSSNNFLRIGVNTSMDAAVGDTRTTYTDYVAINVTSNFRALNPPDIVAMNLTNSSITTNQQNTINVSVDIIRTGNATLNTYTYSGISTPSTTHKANYTYEAGGTFEFGTGPNATNNSYANVSFSDNLRAKVNANTTANDTGHVFDFNVTLSASKSAIKSIRVVWEGFGEYTACSIDVDNIQVSLYNFSSNTWSRIYQACPDPVDIEVVAILNTTQNISDFISSGGILRLAANSTVFVVSLQTDYVAANVTTLSGNWAVNTTLYNVTPGGPDIGQYTQNRAAAGYITNAAIPVDLDGDNDSDVVTSGKTGIFSGDTMITTWRNPGNNINISTWTAFNRTLSNSANTIYSLTAADFDNDGDNDIVGHLSTELILFENPGNNLNISQWATYNRTLDDDRPKIRFADMDGDGDAEIVIAQPVACIISVFDNNGNINFSKWDWYNASSACGRHAIADFDNDGDNDIVVAATQNVSIMENIGTTISSWPSYSRVSVGVADDVEVGDFEGDGDYEIVVFDAEFVSNVTALHNPRYTLNLTTWPSSVTGYGYGGSQHVNLGSIIADFDSDGDLDMLTDIANPRLLNNTNPSNISNWGSTFIGSSNAQDFDFADFDMDGDIDILVANGTTGQVTILNNGQVSSKYIDSQVIDINDAFRASKLYTLNWTPTQTGTGRLYAVVDGAGRYAEVLENNNFVTEASSVSQGNLTITYVTPTPNNETVNQLWAFINVTLSAAGSSSTLEWNELTNYSMTQGLTNTNWYRNQTGLSNDTNYTFRVFANDMGGNTFVGKFRWVFINVSGEGGGGGAGDNLGPVTDLRETVTGDNWILWNWTNPTHVDFCKVEVSVNNTFKVNTTSTSYNFSGLVLQTYEIEARTFACNGTANGWATDLAYTSRCSY